jgi:hypothetical protein
MSEIHSGDGTTQAPAAPAKGPKNEQTKGKDWVKKSKKPKVAPSGEVDFSGRVESIGVKIQTSSGFQLRFTLSGKKASKNIYVLDSSDPAAFSAMVHLVTSAFKNECKIKGRAIVVSARESKVLEFEIKY